MSSVSRWLSGPSCLLQCHLSLGGSLGHLVCYNVICLQVALWAILLATHWPVPRWLSGPSCLQPHPCLLHIHVYLGGSLGHLVCYNVICLQVALWAILLATHSSVPRWLSGPSCLQPHACLLHIHVYLGGSLGHLVCWKGHLSLGGSLGHHVCNHNKMNLTK